uniref:Uncharacterized protein n=1 Tax=Pipistrellus kuhlii TaxID=59472 RepID=A0A7J8B283_PIPKU|nr:hypothetical protein mPipKuh1_007820 [Pipistrellus kuhlii]
MDRMCTPQAILNVLVATLREYKETGESNSSKISYLNTTSMISFQQGSDVRLSVRPCMSFSFKVLETHCFMLTAISLRITVFYAPGPCMSSWLGYSGPIAAKRKDVEVKMLCVQPTPAVLAVTVPCPWSQSLSPQAPPFPSLRLPLRPQSVAQQVWLHLPVSVDRCQVRTASALRGAARWGPSLASSGPLSGSGCVCSCEQHSPGLLVTWHPAGARRRPRCQGTAVGAGAMQHLHLHTSLLQGACSGCLKCTGTLQIRMPSTWRKSLVFKSIQIILSNDNSLHSHSVCRAPAPPRAVHAEDDVASRTSHLFRGQISRGVFAP